MTSTSVLLVLSPLWAPVHRPHITNPWSLSNTSLPSWGPQDLPMAVVPLPSILPTTTLTTVDSNTRSTTSFTNSRPPVTLPVTNPRRRWWKESWDKVSDMKSWEIIQMIARLWERAKMRELVRLRWGVHLERVDLNLSQKIVRKVRKNILLLNLGGWDKNWIIEWKLFLICWGLAWPIILISRGKGH